MSNSLKFSGACKGKTEKMERNFRTLKIHSCWKENLKR